LETKRKRGAPRGNQNALKHGYYSKTFSPEDRFDLDIAADMEGVGEEIALLRFEIKKAISGGDIGNLVPLVHAALALEKLIRTHHRIFLEKRNTLKLAVENVVRNVLLPLGPGAVDSVLTGYVSGQTRPDID